MLHSELPGQARGKLWDCTFAPRKNQVVCLNYDNCWRESHCLGSFESYSFRDDNRKGGHRYYEVWLERSNMTSGEYTHVMCSWKRGFVELVGGVNYDINFRIKDYAVKWEWGSEDTDGWAYKNDERHLTRTWCLTTFIAWRVESNREEELTDIYDGHSNLSA